MCTIIVQSSAPKIFLLLLMMEGLAPWACFSQVLHEGNFAPGANPTTSNYNASVVKIYNATGSLARYENMKIFFCFVKRCSLLQR
jgi:hypothetical protein